MQKNGVLEYEVRGGGEPVLFIHGAFLEDVLLPVIDEPALSDYRLIHYHRRGYGNSDPHRDPFSMAQEAADALSLLRELGIEKTHLAGYSSGGVIAVELARTAPELVQSLTLIEPALLLHGSGGQEMSPFLLRAFEHYGTGDTESAIDTFWQMVSGPEWRSVMGNALPDGPQQASRNAPLFFESEAYQVIRYPFDAAAVEALSAPLLYLVSSAGAPRSADLRYLFRTHQPGLEEYVVNDADHALPLQQPGVIAGHMSDFLARHPL